MAGVVPALRSPASITVKNSKVSNVTVKASSIFGGFIGFGYANTISIEDCKASDITLAPTGPQNNGVYWNSANNQSVTNGVGGIIGTAYQTKLNIENINLSSPIPFWCGRSSWAAWWHPGMALCPT